MRSPLAGPPHGEVPAETEGPPALGTRRLGRRPLPRIEGPDPDAPIMRELGLYEGVTIGGAYRIERPLGVGGMGVVALAHDERLDRTVAIKFIKPGALRVPGDAHVLRQRSARDGARLPSERARGVRVRRARRDAVLRHGVRRRARPSSSGCRARRRRHPARPRRGDAHPRSGVPRRRGDPRGEHGPSRLEAVEPPHRRDDFRVASATSVSRVSSK